MALIGRAAEVNLLAALLEGARRSVGGALVLRGEPGIGKTALLECAIELAADMRILSVTGLEAEAHFGYGVLHRFLLPLMAGIDDLPRPQRDALMAAFGMDEAARANPFLAGLATLTLITTYAREQPLLCVCDDGQWLDAESLRILAFVSRRLTADNVVVVFGTRDSAATAVLDDLPHHRLTGIGERASWELLGLHVKGKLDRDVAARVVGEAQGNPLALQLMAEELETRIPAPGPAGQSGDAIREQFLRQVSGLPGHTRRLLLLAAAEPTGDRDLVWRAARELGVHEAAADLLMAAEPAERAGLLVTAPFVRFRHPLLRSAVYAEAGPEDRRAVHRALARATNADGDVDRRAQHLAAATAGPDEDVAAQLERSADQARRRGGFTAQAALLVRSAELSPEPRGRTRRLIAACEAAIIAGRIDQAEGLLDRIEPYAQGTERARALRLRAMLRISTARAEQAIDAVIESAAYDEHPGRTADTLLLGFYAVSISPVTARHSLRDLAAATDTSAGAETQAPFLVALARTFAYGIGSSAPLLRQALNAAAQSHDPPNGPAVPILTAMAGIEMWADQAVGALCDTYTRHARDRGDLQSLRAVLHASGMLQLWRGKFGAAETLFAEFSEMSAVIGGGERFAGLVRIALLAWRGDDEGTQAAAELISAHRTDPQTVGGFSLQSARQALTILHLGRSRYAEALAQARAVFDDAFPLLHSPILPDLVEAAVRTGDHELARTTLHTLERRAMAADTPWALGLLARSRALLADDPQPLFSQAVELLRGTGIRTDLARTHLLYGEWLRRARHRQAARQQLHTAYTMFHEIGAAAFAERASTELAAIGFRTARSDAAATTTLTPRETVIADLAARGVSNAEIATRLYISVSTVEFHLRNAFQKLGITSRRQLPMP
ncbi:LuxR family transcriptional regulator [Streptosporangium sp. 'caverna']|uniref:helix-turn-helix transcriptional regulator n=1 Tax=Streptosporangium sp. 'caverna' TaxID=2202249 RepID=UPI000D7D8963|nr:LuxR family transcriptional regulator [Streptosporangium sp. 'caverna']AWS42783.1 hypothetical protein DKM19_16830 [Streptosporangium sp. 'caverna']